jgi:HK97 family phage prohead protease
MIPDQPIGRWLSIREDSHGLHVEGKLSLGVARAREVHELMKSGALDGLSIGFQTLARPQRGQEPACAGS